MENNLRRFSSTKCNVCHTKINDTVDHSINKKSLSETQTTAVAPTTTTTSTTAAAAAASTTTTTTTTTVSSSTSINSSSTNSSIITSQKKEIEKKLYQCKGCQLILYCGKEHQKIDWHIHEQFCSAVQQLLKEKNIDHILNINGLIHHKSKDQLQQAKLLTKLYLHFSLKRDLTNNEKELIHFPNICKICYEINYNKLMRCKNCMAVSYCSDEHKLKDSSDHEKICNQLKLYYYSFIANVHTLHLRKDYVKNPLNSKIILTNNLLNFMNEIMMENSNITEFFVSTTMNERFTKYDYEIFSTICNYSYVTTILYSLLLYQSSEKRKFHEQQQKIPYMMVDNEKLIIHIVGAASEIVFFTETECMLLYLCLSHITHIQIIFIGPELPKSTTTYTKEYLIFNKKRLLNIYYVNEKYEEFANKHLLTPTTIDDDTISNKHSNDCDLLNKSLTNNLHINNNNNNGEEEKLLCPFSIRPHLIISFNCGFSEYSAASSTEFDTWRAALHTILVNFQQIPIAFTSYTKLEVQNDFNIIEEIINENHLSLDVICFGIQNLYRDLRPFRNWEDIDDGDEIYYSNNYLNIIITNTTMNATNHLL